MSCSSLSNFAVLNNWLGSGIKVGFTVVHTNIRSLRKHWDEFKITVSSTSPSVDVFVLTEVNIDSSMKSNFPLTGYRSSWLTREGRKGGGIAVFIREGWLTSTVPTSFQHAEAIALKVENQRISLTLVALYRPPSENVSLFLEELETSLGSFGLESNICLIGDFNIDTLSDVKANPCNYLNILSTFGLQCLVDMPTREEHLDGKFVRSCIDHVSVRTSTALASAAVVTHKIADHYFIACKLQLPDSCKPSGKSYEVITFINNNRFDRLVSNYDWNHFISSATKTDAYGNFVHVLGEFYDKSISHKQVRKRRPDCLWLSTEILSLIEEKDSLWARCRRNPLDETARAEFRICRNKVTALIRTAKRRYYNKKFAEARANPKKTWSLINGLRGHSSSQSVDETVRKNFGEDLHSTVENFNDFFSRSQTNALRNTGSHRRTVRSEPSVVDSALLPAMTEEDLRSVLFSFKHHKSPGIDRIRIQDLIRNYATLKTVIIFVVNTFLDTCSVPAELKTAIVRPLYKNGAGGDYKNYRPISILPSLAQILEKHLLTVMNSFIGKQGGLSCSQYGFVEGKGTQSLLEDVCDLLYNSFEHNLVTCGLFLDASRAFDTVCHDILLTKLERLGFRGVFLSLLRNYLTGRSQVVAVCGETSTSLCLQSGVPQGSILSPLLFNVYVNDMAGYVASSKLFQYADDTVIMSSHLNFDSALDTLQKDAILLMNWFSLNAISINVSKTKLVCFHNPHKTVNITKPLFLHSSLCDTSICDCKAVTFVDNVKYLGIYFDSALTWSTQVAYVCRKLRTAAFLMYNLRNLVPVPVRLSIVHALVYSVLRYGVTAYVHCSSLWHAKVDRILKGILKSVVYGIDVKNDTNLFEFLGLPNLYTLYIRTVVTKHFWARSFLQSTSTSHALRHHRNFQVPFAHTTYGQCMRAIYIPTVFNLLPVAALDTSSVRKLKSLLRDIHCEK